MIGSIEKRKCTGCMMCADICPKKAIEFITDDQGFWYPTVNDSCIKCGLCTKKCPSLNSIEDKGDVNTIFSAWSKNEDVRISSTSGGMFWEVATSFINQGGVVAGCRYCNDWRSAEHIIARNIDELVEIKGSKYFQSSTLGIYKAVKEELDKGLKVLFCGTPCQVAALSSFLGGKHKNLYLMDFICRSVNSPKAFKAYIDELEENYGSKVIEVQLKNKDGGWQSLATKVKFENGKESVKDKTEDWWVRGFIFNDLYTRDSCFDCKYKVLPRVNADITIGDFWGIKNRSNEDMFKGISVVLVNTEKGSELFDCAKESLVYSSHEIEEVLPGNPALLTNPVRTEKQDKFFELLKSHSFSYSVSKCICKSPSAKIKDKIAGIIGMLKKMKWFFFDSCIDIKKYVYYNYFSKNIIRTSSAKVIPYKNAILNLDSDSKIVLSGTTNLYIGINKLKGSKSETHVRLNRGAVWKCNNGAYLFYDTVLEIKPDALFESGFFSANGGCVIIVHKKMYFGEDVMLGRNIIIYDSDFHTIYNSKRVACNPPKPVVIEDHVWLTSNIVVQKGVTIGKDSLITSYTTVNKDVPPHSIFGGESVGKVIKDQVAWGREMCPLE